MLDSTKPEQPSLMAIELFTHYIALKDQAATERAMAAALRRDAKTTALKADAYAMKDKAKTLSNQAAASKKAANKALKDFEEQAEFARQLLVARLPPNGNSGMPSKRAYTNLIDVIAYQLKKINVNAAAVSTALANLTSHETWGVALIGQLASIKTNSKEIPN